MAVTCFEAGTVIKYAPTNSAKLTVKGPIAWQGGPYRPVILTGRDDGSVGDGVNQAGTTNIGYYATIALEIDRSTNATAAILQNFRIAHAQTGIAVNGQSGHIFSHGQFVNCQDAIKPTGSSDFSLRNVLFHNTGKVFNGSSSVGRCEHVTVNTATNFNYNNSCTSLYLTNSLLAAVTTVGLPGTYVTNATAILGSASGVFQTMGRGSNYLASASPYRNWSAASTNLNAGLLKVLRTQTTYPPIELTADFTVNTTLSPQAGRDTDTLDLGYHYDALDWIWTTRNLTNATLLLTNGVAVGVYGTKGITLRNGAVFVSEGTPVRLNRLTKYQTVQEGLGTWGTTGSTESLLEVVNSPTPLPEVRLRLTGVSVLADSASGRYLLNNNAYYLVTRFGLADCEVHNAYLHAMPYYADWREQAFGFTNNYFGRCNFYVYSGYFGDTTPFVVDWYNNLFMRSTVSVNNTATNYGLPVRTWSIKDNAFDNATTSGSGYVTNFDCGYINTTALPNSISNVVLAAFVYTNGPLGSWYQVTTNFMDQGSRFAPAAGLYHYTVKADQTKETTSVVEIGFHYVATDANGNPLDYDGDGFPDYFEDRDGDGTVDSGETGWQSASDLGLRVWITQPKSQSLIP